MLEEPNLPEQDGQFTNHTSTTRQKKMKLSIFLQKPEEPLTSQDSPFISLESNVMSESESYLSAPNINFEDDYGPLKWWKENGRLYPVLAKLSRKILCVSATSCASEGLFSTSGRIVGSRSSLIQ